jgi:hypothetical protein
MTPEQRSTIAKKAAVAALVKEVEAEGLTFKGDHEK